MHVTTLPPSHPPGWDRGHFYLTKSWPPVFVWTIWNLSKLFCHRSILRAAPSQCYVKAVKILSVLICSVSLDLFVTVASDFSLIAFYTLVTELANRISNIRCWKLYPLFQYCSVSFFFFFYLINIYVYCKRHVTESTQLLWPVNRQRSYSLITLNRHM